MSEGGKKHGENEPVKAIILNKAQSEIVRRAPSEGLIFAGFVTPEGYPVFTLSMERDMLISDPNLRGLPYCANGTLSPGNRMNIYRLTVDQMNGKTPAFLPENSPRTRTVSPASPSDRGGTFQFTRDELAGVHAGRIDSEELARRAKMAQRGATTAIRPEVARALASQNSSHPPSADEKLGNTNAPLDRPRESTALFDVRTFRGRKSEVGVAIAEEEARKPPEPTAVLPGAEMQGIVGSGPSRVVLGPGGEGGLVAGVMGYVEADNGLITSNLVDIFFDATIGKEDQLQGSEYWPENWRGDLITSIPKEIWRKMDPLIMTKAEFNALVRKMLKDPPKGVWWKGGYAIGILTSEDDLGKVFFVNVDSDGQNAFITMITF